MKQDETPKVIHNNRGNDVVNNDTKTTDDQHIKQITTDTTHNADQLIEHVPKEQLTDETPKNSVDQVDTLKPTEQVTKPLRPLTRKQKAFIQELVNNPKISATQAVKHTYDTSSDNSASQIATENLRKPQIRVELEKYLGTAELVMIEVMNRSNEFSKTGTRDGASYATVAIQASKDIQDRLKGKATQRIEQRSTKVSINIDLTSE